MDSSRIQHHAARQLCSQLRRPLGYLGRLRRRMEVLGFPPTDPLYLDTRRAQEALQDLHVRAHYLSCPQGVGIRPTEPPAV